MSDTTKSRRCVIIGFGAVAKTTFPLVKKHLPWSSFVIVDCRDLTKQELDMLSGQDIKIVKVLFTPDNMTDEVYKIVQDGDMVFDFMGCVDTFAVIKGCSMHKDVLYLNACLEEWEDQCLPSQYMLYAQLEDYKKIVKSTACIDAGANPGLITHFAILALFHMAQSAIDRNVPDAIQLKELLEQKDIPGLATQLQVEQLHISECEEMRPHTMDPFRGHVINSWCVPSFLDEWHKYSEVSIGTSDIEYFKGPGHKLLEGYDPPTTSVPYPTHLHSSTPTKVFVGRCVRHPETIEISKLFFDPKTQHQPTVAFVYHPSQVSLDSLKQENFMELPTSVFTEMNSGPLEGSETMGALLISKREDIPMRWYGSILKCEECRRVGCVMNPTTLQVGACAYAHMLLALKYPEKGITMPHDFDSEEVMKYAAPYLGEIFDGDLPHRLPATWKGLLVDETL